MKNKFISKKDVLREIYKESEYLDSLKSEVCSIEKRLNNLFALSSCFGPGKYVVLKREILYDDFELDRFCKTYC